MACRRAGAQRVVMSRRSLSPLLIDPRDPESDTGSLDRPARTREIVMVYRDARASARQTRTSRLRRQERRALDIAQSGQADQFAIARWAATRDELACRGEPTLSYR